MAEHQRLSTDVGGRLHNRLNQHLTNSHELVKNIHSGKGRSDMASVASNAHKLAVAAGSICCAALNTQAGIVRAFDGWNVQVSLPKK